MSTLVLTDPLFLRHDPGPEHPEAAGRLERLTTSLTESPLPEVTLRRPTPATQEALERIHPAPHLLRLGQVDGRTVQLDPDTRTSPESWSAAVLAAGAAVDAVDAVLDGDFQTAFALVRPPGHHAEPGKAMGFCLLNNVAIAAAAAVARGCQRVLVVDFDVHHGNGTQSAFWGRREVLFQSVHQAAFYPGTGQADEVGGPGAEGFNVNVPLPPACGDADYREVFEQVLLPIGEAFRPELVLVSAGFDAHRDDPLGGMLLTDGAYAAMTRSLRSLAQRWGEGRMVMVLEGGYAPEAVMRSARGCLEVLNGAPAEVPAPLVPASDEVQSMLDTVRRLHAPYWPQLSTSAAAP